MHPETGGSVYQDLAFSASHQFLKCYVHRLISLLDFIFVIFGYHNDVPINHQLYPWILRLSLHSIWTSLKLSLHRLLINVFYITHIALEWQHVKKQLLITRMAALYKQKGYIPTLADSDFITYRSVEQYSCLCGATSIRSTVLRPAWVSEGEGLITQEVEKKTTNDRVFRNGFRQWNFMGMQNVQWSFKNKTRFLIYTLELKLQPFEVFPYVCTGKPYVCNVFRPRSTWGVWSRAHMNVTTITRFVQICSMHASRHCGTTSYTVLLSGQFFFPVSCVSNVAWKKLKKKKNLVWPRPQKRPSSGQRRLDMTHAEEVRNH